MQHDDATIRRAAVLCPGLSLPRYETATEAYDVVIGVNRVVIAYPCQYWVCLDSWTYKDMVPDTLGLPTIVCRQAIREQIEEMHNGMRLVNLAFLDPDDIDLASEPAKWPQFGATISVALAVSLGAKRIDCYGIDLQGRKDFDGYEDRRQRRSPGRWRVERRIFETFLPWLESRGVEVSGVPVGEGVK